MINKKGQTESGPIQTIFIGVMLLGLVSVLMVSYIMTLSTNYGVSIDNEASYNVFTNQSEAYSRSEAIREDLQDLSSGGSGVSAIDAIFSSVTNSVMLFLSAPLLLINIVSGGVQALGLPSIVLDFIIGIAAVAVLFSVVALILKVRA
jgi:hypothetical protein